MSTTTAPSPEDTAAPEESGGEAHRPTTKRSRKRILIVVGAPAIAALAIGLAVRASGGSGGAEPDESAATATSTVEVARRDLVITESYDGELGFGAADPIDAGRDGVVTSVPAVGATVGPGGMLFEIDLEPAILVTGSIPAFRELSVDSDDGADITQLEQWLVDAGYGEGVTVDETFSSATASGVEAWEEAVGRFDPDGIVERGDVVFAPDPVRISTIAADVATQVQSDTAVIETTPTAKVVTLDLEVDAAARLEPGIQVDLELPDGTPTTGTVVDIDTESAASSSDDPTAQAGGGGAAPAAPTVLVTVTIDDPATAEGFDSGSVEVTLERSRVPDATAVPITALLALAEGGYALQVVDSSAPSGYRLVGVEVGSSADGFIEVTGDGVEEGTEVVVAG